MKWRPIETAPKDGTIILVYGYWDGELSEKDIEREVWKAHFNLGTWCLDGSEFYAVEIANPTHWMPLPEPPKKEQNR